MMNFIRNIIYLFKVDLKKELKFQADYCASTEIKREQMEKNNGTDDICE